MSSPKQRTRETGIASSAAEKEAEARHLRAQIEAGRDRIADLDLEIEDRLAELATFDAALHVGLRRERRTLDRVEALRRMLERWTVALEEQPPQRVARVGQGIEERRQRELDGRVEREAALDATLEEEDARPEDAPPPGTSARREEPVVVEDLQDLKSAYRRLARRYHPDLARTEQDRIEFGRMMTRINQAYHAGDLERLVALLRTTLGGGDDGEAAALDIGARLEALTREWAEVRRVIEELEARRREIESMPSYRLWRRSVDEGESAEAFFEAMREQLRGRAHDAQRGLSSAIVGLEKAVKRHNRRRGGGALAPRTTNTLPERFEPGAGEVLAKLLLDEFEIDRSNPVVAREADQLEALAETQPAALRLILLSYVAQLSTHPLPGLERHEDFAERFEHLGRHDERPVALTEVMAELADRLEYGVRSADAARVKLGFRFRSPTLLQAIPIALLRPAVRRELRRVLRVLGDAVCCAQCEEKVFLVPLFRSSGLDSLRAQVCPACGHTHNRYWLPKGDDVQALLNPAYLELELISEWTLRLGGQRCSTQLLPVEVEQMSLGDLKKRVHGDLFERYEVPVRRGQLELWQEGHRVPEKTPLASIDDRYLEIRFGAKSDHDEADVANMIRHRIRHRFD